MLGAHQNISMEPQVECAHIIVGSCPPSVHLRRGHMCMEPQVECAHVNAGQPWAEAIKTMKARATRDLMGNMGHLT